MMNRFISIAGSIAAALGFLLVVNMFLSAADGGGMAILVFQLWAVMLSVAGMLLSIVARVIAKIRQRRLSRFADFALGIALGNILALIITVLIFG